MASELNGPSKAMYDFFISYTHADSDWAEWVGYALEENGFKVVIQAWDFRPGTNFVLEMQNASIKAERTILILSPDYLNSQFASSEWAAAFANDPQGLNQKLVPVMVRACEPKGLLTLIVQIRLVGWDEHSARQKLLDGVNKKRAKPSGPPPFPGQTTIKPPASFPGSEQSESIESTGPRLIPNFIRIPTDIEIRRFVKTAFLIIKNRFSENLKQVSRQEIRIESDFEDRSSSEFIAVMYLDGKRKCSCRIWQGGMHSENNICYSEGTNLFDDGCNEIIGLAQNNKLALTAVMATGHFEFEKSFDLENLSPEGAADYLWYRFVAPLGYT